MVSRLHTLPCFQRKSALVIYAHTFLTDMDCASTSFGESNGEEHRVSQEQITSTPIRPSVITDHLLNDFDGQGYRTETIFSPISAVLPDFKSVERHNPVNENIQRSMQVPSITPSSPTLSIARHQVTATPNTHATKCTCLDRTLSIFEKVQIKLGGIRNGPSVSINDMLQCQKDMLASCEQLLECEKCSSRSEYVMLVVSMCNKMLASIEDMDALISPEFTRGVLQREPARSQHQLTQADPLEEIVQAGSNSEHRLISNHNRGLQMVGWRLDDEDETQVMRSLLGVRIARLGSVIGMLEMAVNANQWLAHKGIIQDIRERFTETKLTMRMK